MSHVMRRTLAASITLAAATTFTLAATAALARPGGGRGGPPPLAMVLERHAEELGVTDEQLDRVDEIMEASREQAEALRESVQRERDSLRTLVESDADTAAVLAQLEKVGEAQTALEAHRLTTTMQVRSLLTDEQRAALQELAAERPERRGRRGARGRRGGCRGGGEDADVQRGRFGRVPQQGGSEPF